MASIDGHEATDRALVREELELRELLKRVMIEPLQPLATSLKLLEETPGKLVAFGNDLQKVRAVIVADLGKKIEEERRKFEAGPATDIAGKADSLMAYREEDRQALETLHLDMKNRLETLAAGMTTYIARLESMEVALLAALVTHLDKISWQVAVLKLINSACLAGIFALSLIAFFRHF